MQRTGAQILWECLVREGVRTVFGYPGGANLPIYDAMLDYPVHHVLVRHEQGAAHAADGYARASGEVGVAIATSGPGAANLVTGIATAYMDSSPIVCITGQVNSKLIGYDAFQEIDVTGITLPITKHNYLVTDVHDLNRVIRGGILHRPLRPARSGVDRHYQRCPAGDVWIGNMTRSRFACAATIPIASRCANHLQQAVEMIHNAQRPVILAGRGVLLSGAMQSLRDTGRADSNPGGDDAAWHRRLPGQPPAQPGHDGHARGSLGQSCHPGGRSAAGDGHALR